MEVDLPFLQPHQTSLRVVVLGTGKVAGHLLPALQQAGHEVVGIWSRTLASARAVAVATGVPVLASLQALPPAEVYILPLPDAAVPEVLAAARFPAGALVVHTAGALPLSVFAGYPHIRGGVLYPLQTFSPGRPINWATVPLFLEAADAAGMRTLRQLAASLSQDVRELTSAQRLQLHVAAVWASNFPNHLLGISHALLQEANLPGELLHPLIQETVEKALSQPPFTAQTGPALRHDASTLARHEAALARHPEWQRLYQQLTASIQHTAQEEAANKPAGS
ncbi:Rossmann-like and DUF2520 domain-containing protein [Hymenobacter pini]|uniref:Rossmann-like and DUF2520 domain-containing protein n=1 Tax=Hymenobacter pini TaxID=2880879 RepID=UPI001CF3FCD3|nr:Rossmann-like and DUF2520 domain-containing protein [Hymenobacter pini]MCA8832835.1 DUF2520 domain-containing protein [Hymenobacter pini]